MKKVLFGLLAVMIVTGLIALGYAFTHPNESESEWIAEEDVWYPSELRPDADNFSDTDENENSEGDIDFEELLPDENFVEFEVENQEEIVTEEAIEPAEPVEPAEPAPQEIPAPTEDHPYPAKEILPPGTAITISRSKVNIRAGADNHSKILKVLRGGDIGEIVEAGVLWSLINCNESQGYVHNSCWEVAPPAE